MHRPKQQCIAILLVWVNTTSASALCRRRVPGELSVRLWQLMLQLTSHHWLSDHCSWPLHAELATDADSCRRKHGQSRRSIYQHRCSPPLPPWRKSLKSPLPYTGNSITTDDNIGSVSTHLAPLPHSDLVCCLDDAWLWSINATHRDTAMVSDRGEEACWWIFWHIGCTGV